MDFEQRRDLCLSLLHADTEDEVVSILTEAGFWEEPEAWCFFGDNENNFAIIGNQQSRPDAALIEKIINSIDARLMGECLKRGVDPEGSTTPKGVREAVAEYFEKPKGYSSSREGKIMNWASAERTGVARGITLAATGAVGRIGNPCFTIADTGEGQTPRKMPATLLSLTRTNKLRIPFVQGRFNMGGTGVLQFCGNRNLQFIISRRDPSIAKRETDDETSPFWGFTIIRREDPVRRRRNSVYTYLAPLDGSVLYFPADALPLMPAYQEAYVRKEQWGTAIKLYEYSIPGFKTNIILDLMYRLDLLLPEPALPIRLHECRSYRGHKGSFETTLSGMFVRLNDNKAENLENGFPDSSYISARGERMIATIFAFKKKKAETYRRNEGIIFTVNGQTHGYLTTDFFRRTTVGMSYLTDSILVILDCSNFGGRAREDLFMNSRDRLRSGDLKREIEKELELLLKHHAGLRELRERRRREEIESKLVDSKPMEELLESILSRSASLAALFLPGKRLQNPFRTISVDQEKREFTGKPHPTYFKFKGKNYGEELERDCTINMRARITFETDVQNDYFSRSEYPGTFELFVEKDCDLRNIESYVLNLRNGLAYLNVKLPSNVAIDDTLKFVAKVADETLIEPFVNVFFLKIREPMRIDRHDHGPRRESPSDREGEKRETPVGIQLPRIMPVTEDKWEGYKFDRFSALKVINAGSDSSNGGDEESLNYDYYVNMDNIYLKTEIKNSRENPDILRARFSYGLVLIGLALIHEDIEARKHQNGESSNEEGELNLEDRIYGVTRALAPVILPIIGNLGQLSSEEIELPDFSGEAV